MIENINQNAITQHEQISSSFSTTNYWNLIPVEIFEKIILQLDVKDIMTSRQVCRRSAYIIDSSNYIRELKSIEKAKSFFAPEDNSMLFTKAINKSFIEYITKNCSLNNNELTMVKWLIDKYNYSAVQFIFAKIMSNTNYTLKKTYTYSFHENAANKYLISDRYFCIIDLFITTDSNKFLCIINNNLFELIANNNKLEIAQQIFKNVKHCYLSLVEIYKNYIILKVDKDEGNIIFLKKHNNNYKNITPQELNNQNCSFIEKQFDKQGNTIFVILVGNILAYYNMHDNNYTNDINITKHLYYSELEVDSVLTSKYNYLMIIYGKNTTSNKKEAHIYKYNNKIDTLVFEPINLYNIDHELVCSPQGDSLIIKYFDSDNKLMNYSVYKIFNNKLQEIYTTSNSYIGSHRRHVRTISKYSNNGKNIILDINFDTMVYISANNKIELFDIGKTKQYVFNESGYILLSLKNDMIKIYNFHRGIKETSIILCKDTVFGVKFSPNSQLIATVEAIHHQGTCARYEDLLRIYKIMSIATNGNITMLPIPKAIAEYYSKGIRNFKFHPDGTKLIIEKFRSIVILEISKADTTTNNNNLN